MAAAREMGVKQPTASRIVAALERQVGAALQTRSAPAVTPTEAGADYLARSEAILAALDEADRAAGGDGELRISWHAAGHGPARRGPSLASPHAQAQAARAPVWMIVPTCSPRSAAVSRPGVRPFTICT